MLYIFFILLIINSPLFSMELSKETKNVKDALFGQIQKSENLISPNDYRNLKQSDKNTIKTIIFNNPIQTKIIENKKYMIIQPPKNTPEFDKQLLQLPPDIQKILTNFYGSTVLFKETQDERPLLNKKAIKESRLQNAVALAAIASCLTSGIHCLTSDDWNGESVTMICVGVFATMLVYYHLYNTIFPVRKGLPLYQLNGYKVLPLLTENG